MINRGWNRFVKDHNMTKINEISTWDQNGIHMLHAAAGYNPKSIYFGKIIGRFEYNGRVFQFTYNIHQPKQESSKLSNRMTNVKEFIYYTMDEEKPGCPVLEDTMTFNDAFIGFMPDKDLDTDNYAFRQLSRTITQYSRENGLCRKIKKFDKKHTDWLI